MSMQPLLFVLKVYGIAIVISFLCAFIIWIIVYSLASMAKKPAADNRVLSAKPAPEESTDDGELSEDIPLDHVATIAAAVHCLLGEATVLRIEDTRHRTAWVAEGRLVHHSSHNPIRNR